MPIRRILSGLSLLVCLSACYVLSFGPAHWCCIDDRGEFDRHELSDSALLAFHSPLIHIYQSGPEPAQDALARYLELWGAP
jgi:hypothetical protein